MPFFHKLVESFSKSIVGSDWKFPGLADCKAAFADQEGPPMLPPVSEAASSSIVPASSPVPSTRKRPRAAAPAKHSKKRGKKAA